MGEKGVMDREWGKGSDEESERDGAMKREEVMERVRWERWNAEERVKVQKRGWLKESEGKKDEVIESMRERENMMKEERVRKKEGDGERVRLSEREWWESEGERGGDIESEGKKGGWWKEWGWKRGGDESEGDKVKE